MFEAADFDRHHSAESDSILAQGHGKRISSPLKAPVDAIAYERAVRTILEAGFKARVLSWRSAYDLGAQNNLSLEALRERVSQCVRLIDAGLGCAIDETLFAALVFHYAPLARDIARQPR
ncbi:hypothetical protein [Cohaesibacter intestini]|uniref:hypothetical protein n=1 Tax=Cohaesibacter intestini TaxID=2211145 RepID=UPI000DEAA4AA|nr:hypothetical protein [Cohaesibacter intestini]